MSSVPAWLQIAAHVTAMIGVILGLLFGLFVLWPSIRRQNRLATRFIDFLDKSEKGAVDKILQDL